MYYIFTTISTTPTIATTTVTITNAVNRIKNLMRIWEYCEFKRRVLEKKRKPKAREKLC